jgi:hypothetical protein
MDGSGALNGHAAPLLFPELLGERFDALPPKVRDLHLGSGTQRLVGEVTVDRGSGWLSRLCAWATRLPPAGAGPIAVDICAAPCAERWTRHIAGHAMPSRLWADQGLLCERLGLVTFGFRLAVEENASGDRALVWRVAQVRALGIALPTVWFTDVVARESQRGERYCFDVRAVLPLVGLLVRYEGWLHVD